MTIAHDRPSGTPSSRGAVGRPARAFLGGESPLQERRIPSRRIDMRCGGSCVGADRRSATEGRCQLLAGHDGAHALMYGGREERVVVEWFDEDGTPIRREEGWQGLAWMRGYPFPAWFEPTA